jgi:hypothetical protein
VDLSTKLRNVLSRGNLIPILNLMPCITESEDQLQRNAHNVGVPLLLTLIG